ncbi:hypothetical protein RJT34_27868 [Clitoria ternatea]|uniref:MBD domain-containing protein n=1 Tax=Clitoria ternatea TaxID=43366 RepID=A0AAN9FAG5_CLITE
MEQGNGNGEGKRKSETLASEITKETITKIKRNRYLRGSGNEPTLCTIHDKTSPGYEWLLPGWVAEERHMTSGRVYRYYYDPEGHLYKTRSEVLAAWEKTGMVVVDN